MKAAYCGGCGGLVGLPASPRLSVQCECGRVRGRWVDAARGTCLVGESLRPVPAGPVEEMCQLMARRRAVLAVTGDVGAEVFDEFEPGWREAWDEAARAAASSDLDSPSCAWLLGLHNAVLRGAHAKVPRPPTLPEYVAWREANGHLFRQMETMVVRFRPGTTGDSKFVGLAHFVSGTWEPPEPAVSESA